MTKLPIINGFMWGETGNRLPRPSKLKLGMYADADVNIDLESYNEIYRLEVRVGAQVSIPRDSKDEYVGVVKETRGRIMRYVYEPIQEDVRNAYFLLRDEGVSENEEGMVKLREILESLNEAFTGQLPSE